MVRAQARGLYDFANFDPFNTHCWKKLRWIIEELESQQTQEICKIRHNHYVTMAAHGNLDPESFEQMQNSAHEAMNNLVAAVYPWIADEIAGIKTQSSIEALVDTYHEIYGRPGDPSYELMIAGMEKVFKKGPLSRSEKEADRKAWIERKEALKKSQGQS